MIEVGRLEGKEWDAIRDSLRELVRSEFGEASIEDIQIESVEDENGERYLRVFIALAPKAKVDAGKAVGLQRNIFPALKGVASDMFPVISFLSQKDFQTRRAAC